MRLVSSPPLIVVCFIIRCFRSVWSRPVPSKKKKPTPEPLVESSLIKSFSLDDVSVNVLSIPDDVQRFLSGFSHWLFRVID
jgi:hypothetical protein